MSQEIHSQKEEVMKAFDLAEVRRFIADVESRLDQCDHGEGTVCATLDLTLRFYAELCCEFCERVREWGRAVFHGKAAFDPEVERLWLEQGLELYRRACNLWSHAQKMEGECFELEGGSALGSALFHLDRLLFPWVSPKLAVAPLARRGMGISEAEKEEIQKRIEALPPLPQDWEPTDPRQKRLYKMFRKQRTA